MRETEFRAWDIEEGCWIPSELIAITYDGRLITCDNIYSPFAKEVIPVTVFFYTGLHDKNGKKIYEGNIVKDEGKQKWRSSPIVGVVRYNAPSFYVDVEGQRNELDELWEVIGDICENPELVKS